jgi:hypothetical protein
MDSRFGDFAVLAIMSIWCWQTSWSQKIFLKQESISARPYQACFINLKAKVHHQLDFVSVKILKEDASFQDYKLSTNLKVNSKLT